MSSFGKVLNLMDFHLYAKVPFCSFNIFFFHFQQIRKSHPNSAESLDKYLNKLFIFQRLENENGGGLEAKEQKIVHTFSFTVMCVYLTGLFGVEGERENRE